MTILKIKMWFLNETILELRYGNFYVLNCIAFYTNKFTKIIQKNTFLPSHLINCNNFIVLLPYSAIQIVD